MMQFAFDTTPATSLPPEAASGTSVLEAGPYERLHTPDNSKIAGMVEHSADKTLEYAKSHYHAVAAACRGDFEVGTGSLEGWLEENVPWGPNVDEAYKKAVLPPNLTTLLRKAATSKDERGMYKPYVESFSRWSLKLPSGARKPAFKICGNQADPFCDGLKVDVATYGDDPGNTDFGLMDTQVEFKLKGSDPFCDPKPGEKHIDREHGVNLDTDTCREVLGQITSYAGTSLSMNFRTHLFTVLIIGRHARLIRWDRGGAIVSRAFEYAHSRSPLVEFYLRYWQLSRRDQGFEADVMTLDKLDKDVQVALEHFNRHDEDYWYGLSDQQRVDVNSPRRWFKLATGGMRFIVPEPLYHRRFCTPFHRASRYSLAYCVDTKTLCFLKDYWRELSARSLSESDMYNVLKERRIPNIAEKLIGADIPNTETVGGPRRLILHRLALKTLARSLTTFKWGKVLISCIAEIFETILKAWEAGILHRDISDHNIMIVDRNGESHGILVDWELSIVLEPERMRDPPRSGKTGTYQFMSAYLLDQPIGQPVAHSHLDDLESAFWSLAFTALHYIKIMPSNSRSAYADPEVLWNQVENLFNAKFSGFSKQSTLMCWAAKSSLRPQFVLQGMQDLLGSLSRILYGRYAPQPYKPLELEDPDQLRSLFDLAIQAMPPLTHDGHGKWVATEADVDAEAPPADYVVNEMRPSQLGHHRKTQSFRDSRVDALIGRSWKRSLEESVEEQEASNFSSTMESKSASKKRTLQDRGGRKQPRR
ncbi:hypothetical protein PM082_020899 [Marasmius tenuissimus]|nr:hypothetical protein PM082_020899 [Marasmius tenuissimus]